MLDDSQSATQSPEELEDLCLQLDHQLGVNYDHELIADLTASHETLSSDEEDILHKGGSTHYGEAPLSWVDSPQGRQLRLCNIECPVCGCEFLLETGDKEPTVEVCDSGDSLPEPMDTSTDSPDESPRHWLDSLYAKGPSGEYVLDADRYGPLYENS